MMDRLAEYLSDDTDALEGDQAESEQFEERRKKPRPPKDRRRNGTAELLYYFAANR